MLSEFSLSLGFCLGLKMKYPQRSELSDYLPYGIIRGMEKAVSLFVDVIVSWLQFINYFPSFLRNQPTTRSIVVQILLLWVTFPMWRLHINRASHGLIWCSTTFLCPQSWYSLMESPSVVIQTDLSWQHCVYCNVTTEFHHQKICHMILFFNTKPSECLIDALCILRNKGCAVHIDNTMTLSEVVAKLLKMWGQTNKQLLPHVRWPVTHSHTSTILHEVADLLPPLPTLPAKSCVEIVKSCDICKALLSNKTMIVKVFL